MSKHALRYNCINVLFLLCVLQQKQAAELDLSTEVATRLNLVDRETPADTHLAHTRHSDEDTPRLTKVRRSGVRCGHCVEVSMDAVSFISCIYCLCV